MFLTQKMFQLHITKGDIFIDSAAIKGFQLYTQPSTDPDTPTCLLGIYLMPHIIVNHLQTKDARNLHSS